MLRQMFSPFAMRKFGCFFAGVNLPALFPEKICIESVYYLLSSVLSYYRGVNHLNISNFSNHKYLLIAFCHAAYGFYRSFLHCRILIPVRIFLSHENQ